MRRHGLSCRRQRHERQRAKGRQIDPVRPGFEIGNGIELRRAGIRHGEIDEGVGAVAALQPIATKSADDGIGAVVAVDCSGSSVDRVIAVIALNRVIVGSCIQRVIFAGAVDGILAGARIDDLKFIAVSCNGVAAGSPEDEWRIGYFAVPQGEVVEIVGARIGAATDGDRHHCGSHREGIGQGIADIERLHGAVGVVEGVGPHAGRRHHEGAVAARARPRGADCRERIGGVVDVSIDEFADRGRRARCGIGNADSDLIGLAARERAVRNRDCRGFGRGRRQRIARVIAWNIGVNAGRAVEVERATDTGPRHIVQRCFAGGAAADAVGQHGVLAGTTGNEGSVRRVRARGLDVVHRCEGQCSKWQRAEFRRIVVIWRAPRVPSDC